MEGEWKQITTPERSREYVFASGSLKIQNVSRVLVRPSGTHRLETATGEKYIVPSGWLAIKIEADSWSF